MRRIISAALIAAVPSAAISQDLLNQLQPQGGQVFQPLNQAPIVLSREPSNPEPRAGVSEFDRPRNDDFTFREALTREAVPTENASEIDELSDRLLQGMVIPAVFDVAVSSELPGALRATTTRGTYSFDGKKLLVPAGSTLYGEYRAGTQLSQTRLLIVWTRLVTPDGISAQIGSQGTDPLGRSGATGIVDTHFLERFGSAALISVIGAIPVAIAASSDNQATVETGRRVADDFSNATESAVEQYLLIKPTINIPQGTEVTVLLQRDVVFPQFF